MGATLIGIVDHQHVAGYPLPAADEVTHGERHTAEVYRDMRGLGTQPAIAVKQRTGVVEPVTAPISSHSAEIRLAKILS